MSLSNLCPSLGIFMTLVDSYAANVYIVCKRAKRGGVIFVKTQIFLHFCRESMLKSIKNIDNKE